jgi:hypothetical protein
MLTGRSMTRNLPHLVSNSTSNGEEPGKHQHKVENNCDQEELTPAQFSLCHHFTSSSSLTPTVHWRQLPRPCGRDRPDATAAVRRASGKQTRARGGLPCRPLRRLAIPAVAMMASAVGNFDRTSWVPKSINLQALPQATASCRFPSYN